MERKVSLQPITKEYNVISDGGQTAEWIPYSRNGLVFSDRHLQPGETIHVVISGSGLIQTGLLLKNPSLLTDLRTIQARDIRFIFDNKLELEEYTIIIEIKRGLLRHSVTFFHAGYTNVVKICICKSAWLVLNLCYGDLEVKLGKDGGKGIVFNRTCGPNIKLLDAERSSVSLKTKCPPFQCILDQKVFNGGILNFQMRPVQNYTHRLCPTELIIGYILELPSKSDDSNLRHYDLNLTEGMWKKCQMFRGNLCRGKLKIEVKPKSLLIFINSNAKIYFKEIETVHNNSGICFVLQGFGVKLEILEPFIQTQGNKVEVKNEDLLSSIDSSGYVRTELINMFRKPRDENTKWNEIDMEYKSVESKFQDNEIEDSDPMLDSLGYVRLEECSSHCGTSGSKYEQIWPINPHYEKLRMRPRKPNYETIWPINSQYEKIQLKNPHHENTSQI